jgi:preprotein translocase subunit SecY
MFTALLEAFRTPDLRNKILFTLGMLVVFRFLAHVPLPGVDQTQLQNVLAGSQLLNLLDLFSGGGLAKLVGGRARREPLHQRLDHHDPLNQTIPALERLSKEGEYGRNKINQYTRILTVPLALLQGIGVAVFMQRSGVLPGVRPDDLASRSRSCLADVGNADPDVARRADQRARHRQRHQLHHLRGHRRTAADTDRSRPSRSSRTSSRLASIAIIAILVIAAIIFIQEGQRRIPVQYAKRVRGTRMYSGGSTFIPLRVNSAGVIPIIFAISILLLPSQVGAVLHELGDRVAEERLDAIVAAFQNPVFYNSLYFLLVVVFTFFYTAFTFIPNDVAENIKRYGGFIPGIRPGKPTADFLQRVVTRITIAGALFLGIVAVMPTLIGDLTGVQTLRLGGTSILIVVGVVVETMKQLEAQLLQRSYEGFIR